MTVTVQLPTDMVEALRALAGHRGRDLDSTIAELLGEQLQRQAAFALPPSPQAPTESDLLQQIQQGLPEATWQRYHDLQAKREAEQLTPQEHAELIALTDQIEGWNVRRLELAQQLAARRGVSWQEIVVELGLAAPAQA
jgi:hypothetical protein